MTYAKLSQETGIAEITLRKAGSKLGYRMSMASIEKICRALQATPGDLLELIDDPPEPEPSPKKTKKKKKKK